MKRSSTYNNSITWNPDGIPCFAGFHGAGLELATPVKYSPGVKFHGVHPMKSQLGSFHGVNLQLETCNLKPVGA
ncbi:hypothetical protein SAMN05444280_11388 [Tangfeifania diversioriginum]|uniref:Uncharacterized protein n=1 Tax=Tangfeifania diversioriginum TaxID=1168035 RepID=A0A1M6HHB8_9BACT|nr:hypothetical protein [Tangfeifania diversioriginum]SHJ21544.1 hypothetical protein SAMN05444280_11388 [Tangfeifania diversioriginum]